MKRKRGTVQEPEAETASGEETAELSAEPVEPLPDPWSFPVVSGDSDASDGRVAEPTYKVTPKRRVKTKSGVLGSGESVTAELVGGEATLAALVRGGSVVQG